MAERAKLRAAAKRRESEPISKGPASHLSLSSSKLSWRGFRACGWRYVWSTFPDLAFASLCYIPPGGKSKRAGGVAGKDYFVGERARDQAYFEECDTNSEQSIVGGTQKSLEIGHDSGISSPAPMSSRASSSRNLASSAERRPTLKRHLLAKVKKSGKGKKRKHCSAALTSAEQLASIIEAEARKEESTKRHHDVNDKQETITSPTEMGVSAIAGDSDTVHSVDVLPSARPLCEDPDAVKAAVERYCLSGAQLVGTFNKIRCNLPSDSAVSPIGRLKRKRNSEQQRPSLVPTLLSAKIPLLRLRPKASVVRLDLAGHFKTLSCCRVAMQRVPVDGFSSYESGDFVEAYVGAIQIMKASALDKDNATNTTSFHLSAEWVSEKNIRFVMKEVIPGCEKSGMSAILHRTNQVRGLGMGIDGDTCNIDRMFINVNLRRTGCGTRALAAISAWVHLTSPEVCRWRVGAPTAKGSKFYKALGFEANGAGDLFLGS